MTCEEDVLKIGKKLEKLISSNSADHGGAEDLLKKLQDLPMTLAVLQKTRIGMTVNNFRKASSKDEVIVLAKGLIKSWKKLLPADSGGNAKSEKDKKEKPKESQNGSPEQSMETESGTDKSSAGQGDNPTLTRQNSTASITNDPVRLKCRELIVNALKTEEEIEGAGTPDDIGPKVEDAIYAEFKNTDSKYKNRVRSRIANLKDKKNPKLREHVLLGLIPPERMASMTAEEMASDALKELRAKLTKEAINDHQMAKNEGTTTDLFKCGRCGKKNCTYNQLQTRSSDEPMTTFVFCNECGNRWKFC